MVNILGLLFVIALIYAALQQIRKRPSDMRPLSKTSIPLAGLVFVAISAALGWAVLKTAPHNSGTWIGYGIAQLVLSGALAFYIVASLLRTSR